MNDWIREKELNYWDIKLETKERIEIYYEMMVEREGEDLEKGGENKNDSIKDWSEDDALEKDNWSARLLGKKCHRIITQKAWLSNT